MQYVKYANPTLYYFYVKLVIDFMRTLYEIYINLFDSEPLLSVFTNKLGSFRENFLMSGSLTFYPPNILNKRLKSKLVLLSTIYRRGV